MTRFTHLSNLRPVGPRPRMRPAAYASRRRRAFGTTKPRAADAARVTPQACLRHDASEGHEGEAFVQEK
jgi:hypothetical protein